MIVNVRFAGPSTPRSLAAVPETVTRFAGAATSFGLAVIVTVPVLVVVPSAIVSVDPLST